MGQRKWKKIILVFGILFLLLFSFWYGGGSAGLQGFSSADNQETVSQEKKDTGRLVSDNADNKDKNTTEKDYKKDDNIFKQIVMNITKKKASSDTSKNTQNNKRAQKNANRAADKSKKKSKKSKKKSSSASKDKTEPESGNNGENSNSSSGQNTESTNHEQDSNNNTTADSNSSAEDDNGTITCTVFISCAVLLDKMDSLPAAKRKLVPSDGILLKTTTVKIKEGSTVFDVLRQAAKDNKIHLEYSFTPIYKSYYIEGIGNLYQFDSGELSGWMYSVNGEFPGNGCSSYTVKSGDVIQWVYTCSLGKDVGSYFEE